MDYAKEIAKAGLEIGAIKLNPDKPFQWASGFRMPIYNDNRMFLFYPKNRDLIVEGFNNKLSMEYYDFIAGTSTAGIPWGSVIMDRKKVPFVYIRDKPKDHGLKNQIEGIDADKDLNGLTGIVIEDLISTGGSSARAVQAVRDAKAEANLCVAIFDYGLDKAVSEFSSLEPKCKVESLLTYDILLQTAKEAGYLNEEQIKLLEEWRADPFNWGANHGFPKVEKGDKK